MPLGQGIEELWDAVRDRVEVSGHEPVWHVTAGCFDTALGYARERFDDPAVLERSDRHRLWPRVTLTVTTDADLAESAPPLEDLASPVVPAQPAVAAYEAADRGAVGLVSRPGGATAEQTAPVDAPGSPDTATGLPPSLEAIFAHQEQQRAARRATADA